MAKITFKGQSEYFGKLQQLEQAFAKDATLEKAVRAGAAPVAGRIRKNLEALPEENFRKLREGEIFHGIPKGQKQDLLDSFGLAPITRDRSGFVHTKAGFDGYGSFPTADYPNGISNQLVAAATESGSSVRKKMPFIRPAEKAARQEAIDAMGDAVDGEIKNIFGGNM